MGWRQVDEGWEVAPPNKDATSPPAPQTLRPGQESMAPSTASPTIHPSIYPSHATTGIPFAYSISDNEDEDPSTPAE